MEQGTNDISTIIKTAANLLSMNQSTPNDGPYVGFRHNMRIIDDI
jgi:hypothetical protein